MARGGLSSEVLDARIHDGESAAAARFRIVRAAVDALRDAGPLVLVLEDLHWADAASLALLRQLATDIADVPLLVIGTVRQPGDGFPLADFAGLPAVEILTLAPLEPAAVASFLAQQADGPVHGSWAGVVHRLGGGNPLYIRELARLLARGDRLRAPASEVDLPDGLRRLVARRTAQLSEAARDLLGGAAALGAQVDVDVLRGAATEPAAVDGLLAEAVRAGLLIDDPWHPATLRFAHDVVRQVRYGELSRTERIGWHGRIADALSAAGATAGEVARHRIRAAVDEGSRRTAQESCADAARAAARGLDHTEAVRWYGRALEVAPGVTDLLLARAEAAYRDGQLDVALADCAAVLDIAEAGNRADLGAEAALVVRGVAGFMSPALIVLCERALALLAGAGGAGEAAGWVTRVGAARWARCGAGWTGWTGRCTLGCLRNTRFCSRTVGTWRGPSRSAGGRWSWPNGREGPRRSWPRSTRAVRCSIRPTTWTRWWSSLTGSVRWPATAAARTPSCGAGAGGWTPC